MFKQLIVYRLAPTWSPDLDKAREDLARVTFFACAPTQQKSAGFVPPREENGALIESVGGQWIARLMTEVRTVPSATLKRSTDKLADTIEENTGRRPGKKQMKELKEQVLLDLLPHAFPKQSTTWVWIDPKTRLLAIDCGSQAKADEVVSLLVKAIDGLAISLVQTEMPAAAAMAHWLGTGEAPYQFTIDRECELKSPDEMKSVVRYRKHPLDTDEVKQHIQAGKVPTRVALTWRDRMSFVLTEALQVKKLEFMDVVFEGPDSSARRGKVDQAEAFEADVAISTGELRQLIPDLLEALGGESILGQAA